MSKKAKVGFIFTISLMLLLSLSCAQDEGKKKNTDYSAPPVSGMEINGKGNISLDQLKGKVVLLNFWATWCPPCRAEIPDLIRLQEKYGNDLVILGISVDKEGVDLVREFTKEMGITYPVIMGDNQLTMSYGGIRSIPTSFVVDRQGDLVAKIVGARSYDEFEAQILPSISKK